MGGSMPDGASALPQRVCMRPWMIARMVRARHCVSMGFLACCHDAVALLAHVVRSLCSFTALWGSQRPKRCRHEYEPDGTSCLSTSWGACRRLLFCRDVLQITISVTRRVDGAEGQLGRWFRHHWCRVFDCFRQLCWPTDSTQPAVSDAARQDKKVGLRSGL